MKLRTLLSNILVGIPAGFLILMGTLLFTTLLEKFIQAGPWAMLIILCATALTVGLIARWLRPVHGLGTAAAAGTVAALILLYLRLTSAPGAKSSLAFGPAGMLAAVGFCIVGGWLTSRLRKQA